MKGINITSAIAHRALSGVTRSQTAATSRDGLPAAAARVLCGQALMVLLLVTILGGSKRPDIFVRY